MDFEILLEGTMIGAELNALSEANIVISKDAKTGDEFAQAVINAFVAQINDMVNIVQKIREAVKRNIDKLVANKEKVIQILKDSGTLTEVAQGTITFGEKLEKKIETHIEKYSAEKEVAQAISKDLEALKNISKKKISNEDPVQVYQNILTSLKSLYNYGKSLQMTLDRKIRKYFVSSSKDNKLEKWRAELKKAFESANKSQHAFEVGAVTAKAKNTVEAALKSAKSTLDDMTKTINDSGIRTQFDAYNSAAQDWNNLVKKSKFAKTIGLEQVPVMKSGEIRFPTPKEAATAEKQATSALDKVKGKISDLIEKLKSQINEPSIATVAVSVVIAIATYLVFYGAVKAAGGKVGSPVAITTTFKAAAAVVKEATFGKKLLIIALFGIVSAAFVAAGTVGFNFIKNKLSK